MLSQLLNVIASMGWSHLIIVSNVTSDRNLESVLTQNLSDRGVQHVLVSCSEALSGDWLHQVVRTGVDSWRPLHFVLMCSVSCIVSTLTQASVLDKELGTLTAFPLTSRWLVVTTRSDNIPNLPNVTDITMENVAVVDFSGLICDRTRKCHHQSDHSRPAVYMLDNSPEGRSWTPVYHCKERYPTQTAPAVPASGQANFNFPESVPFPHTQRGYNGRRLRVAVKEWMAFLNSRPENGTKVWYGLLMDILQEAALVLNFTYDLVDASTSLWGSGTAKDPEFGTFFGRVIRKEVDLGLTPTDTFWQRAKEMDFTDVIMFSSGAMVYHPPPSAPFRGLLSVISPLLIVAISGALTAVTLLVVYLEVMCIWSQRDCDKAQADNDRHRTGPVGMPQDADLPSCGSILLNVLLAVGAALLLEPTEIKMASRPSQILVWSWWMLSLVLAAAYSGTLTAFLSSSQQPLLFSRPQDLLTKTHTYTWGTIRDNTMSIFLESSKDPLYRQIWSNIQHFAVTDPEVLTANTTALVSKVCHEDFVLIMDYVSALDLFRMYNDVIIVSADIRTVMFGLVVPKGSALAEPLSNVIHSLQSSGQLSQWTDKWFPRKPSTTAAPGPMVISLPHVLDVLHVLPVLVGLALGIMTLEVIYDRWKKT